MVQIVVKKGLDIPIQGNPSGNVIKKSLFENSREIYALDLTVFLEKRWVLLKKPGEEILIGEGILAEKDNPSFIVVSPVAGTLLEITRGSKRALHKVLIERKEDSFVQKDSLSLKDLDKHQILNRILELGIFPFIKLRPLDRLASPLSFPKTIFVKAIESFPFLPSSELQVEGHQEAFQMGLSALKKLTSGLVHLVYSKETKEKAFYEAVDVVKHTATGPHPVGTHSVHMEAIEPSISFNDIIWTLDVLGVIKIGYAFLQGRYFPDKIIGLGGPAVLENKASFFKIREGSPVKNIIEGNLKNISSRIISGDPLRGEKIDKEGHVGFYDYAVSVIPESEEREFLHFFRLGLKKYSFSKAYFSGHLNSLKKYFFTTSQHGEERPFMDSTMVDKVMPLNIPTVPLIKAVMAEDFDLAEEMGLLSIAVEDFALPQFVCPSKVDIMDIMKQGLKKYQQEMMG